MFSNAPTTDCLPNKPQAKKKMKYLSYSCTEITRQYLIQIACSYRIKKKGLRHKGMLFMQGLSYKGAAISRHTNYYRPAGRKTPPKISY